MAEKKQSNREKIKQIVAGIEDGIQQIFQSEHYADYLRTMSRFHTYSYKNTILIHMQMPTATQVAGFNKWKNQFGRHVKKGREGPDHHCSHAVQEKDRGNEAGPGHQSAGAGQ